MISVIEFVGAPLDKLITGWLVRFVVGGKPAIGLCSMMTECSGEIRGW